MENEASPSADGDRLGGHFMTDDVTKSRGKEREEKWSEEIENVNEKSDSNLYTYIGIAVIVLGIVVGLLSFSLSTTFINICLGVVIMGIGDIIKAVHRKNLTRKE